MKNRLKYLANYMALDVLLFLIFFYCIVLGTYLIVYWLPSYDQLINIIPFLLVGVFFMRYRFYPGLAFKAEKKLRAPVS